jgi:SAM-dependent methyltransferase
LPESFVQCAIGDGSFTLLRYPQGYHQVFREIHRVLKPGGGLAIRYFCRPNDSEALTQIEEDLRNRKIENIHVLKWRVAMALHQSIHLGVPVDEIWQALNKMIPDRDELERHTGWNRRVIDTFDVFRGSPAVFTFPTLEEIRQISAPFFLETSTYIPQYELGPCCPTVIYRRRDSSS